MMRHEGHTIDAGEDIGGQPMPNYQEAKKNRLNVDGAGFGILP